VVLLTDSRARPDGSADRVAGPSSAAATCDLGLVENVQTMTQSWDPERLEFKLLPENVASNLMRAATMLTAWELIHSDIVAAVKDFDLIGFDENGYTYDEGYQNKVLTRVTKDSGIFDASVAWLVENEALRESDVELLGALRAQRNDLAHQMAKYIVDPEHEVSLDLLTQAREVIARLGRFWGQIEVDIHPNFEDREVDVDAIRSGASLLYDYVLSLVSMPLGSTDPKPEEQINLPS